MRRTRTPKLRPHLSGADQGTARRNRILIALFVVVAIAIVWLSAVILLGGSGDEQGSSGQRDDTPDGQRQEGGPGGGPGERDSSDSRPDGGEGAPSEEDPVEAEEVSQAMGPPAGGGVPPGEVPIEDEEGRTNGQRGFVSAFVGAAYGYSGSDVEEYLSGVSGRVDRGSYLASPAGAEIERYAKVVASGGAENATVMDDYRIIAGPAVNKPLPDDRVAELLTPQANKAVSDGYTEQELSGATLATVKYAMGDRYGNPEEGEDFGEVYGDVDHYAQDLLLIGGGSTNAKQEASGITILAGSTPRPIEDPNADVPPPDAPKVGYEPPGGHGHAHEHGAS